LFLVFGSNALTCAGAVLSLYLIITRRSKQAAAGLIFLGLSGQVMVFFQALWGRNTFFGITFVLNEYNLLALIEVSGILGWGFTLAGLKSKKHNK
jgi:hypothetical protein